MRKRFRRLRSLGCASCLLVILLWIAGLIALVRALSDLWQRQSAQRQGRKAESPLDCLFIPPKIYRRPDPLIYDQYYLMAQGLAVTWDNPDIQLYDQAGTPVSSTALVAGQPYTVRARIWNGSLDAPAVNMPVRFSFLEFGIGTTRHALGETTVDLPVKGAPGCPAYADMRWTPPHSGHFCLQVELIWDDDANPANNLGQENTQVKALNSPHAAFSFPVRNDAGEARTLRLAVDGYAIPARRPCPPDERAATPRLTPEEVDAHRREALREHGRAAYPLPEGWQIALEPRELRLGAGEQQDVTVDVTAPDGFSGRKAFNVNAFDGEALVGGVTLSVQG